jgi:hypothetical protein
MQNITQTIPGTYPKQYLAHIIYISKMYKKKHKKTGEK